MADILSLAKQAEPYIIGRRRYYHSCPELSGEEAETTKAIAADLQAMGLEPKFFRSQYGLTAEIRGAYSGKTAVLRADIDGLNIREETGLPFASTNGYMHACGHDCHIAMQLGAAKILSGIRDELHGTVRLLFQPSEENSKGALQSIAEGCLEGADVIYGTHIWGTVPAPKIDITPGFRMAASNRFRITVKGTAAHASAPHLGADAITAACSIIQGLQLLVTRFNCATDPVVLTVATIHGGEQYNSVADRVEMEGTIRHFRMDHSLEEEMRRVIGGIADAMKVGWEMEYLYLADPVCNRYSSVTELCRNTAEKLFGPGYQADMPTLMSSEDFAWYLEKIPGVFTYIGSSNPQKGITGTNHQSTYDVDESVLKNGAALAAGFAADFLAE